MLEISSAVRCWSCCDTPARMPIDASYSVPFTITCEMPNSKSWLKTSVAVEIPRVA